MPQDHSDSDAPASGAGPHHLDAMVDLQHAVHRAVLRGDPRVTPEVRALVRALCDQARAKGMRAEQLLPVLKRLWFSLPDVRHLVHGGHGHPLYDSMVSAAIQEMYRD